MRARAKLAALAGALKIEHPEIVIPEDEIHLSRASKLVAFCDLSALRQIGAAGFEPATSRV
jgi:hypothetical protein